MKLRLNILGILFVVGGVLGGWWFLAANAVSEAHAQAQGQCGPGRTCSSARFLSGDGSAATPALAFGSDTDTGVYRSAANELSFATGGTQRVKIDSSGFLTAPRFYGPSTDSLRLNSTIPAASVNSSTVPAVFMSSVVALDSNDLILSIATNGGTARFTVDNEGDIVAAGNGTVAGTALTVTGEGGEVKTTYAELTQVAAPRTCDASNHGTIALVGTASSAVDDELCFCRSDNEASPAYTWTSLTGGACGS